MKYRPSLAFILCLIPMLAAGAAGAWAWKKADSVPMHIRAHATFLQVLRYKEEPPRIPRTPEQIEQARQASIDLREKLVVEFPALRITEHPVPDDQNGFLLLFKLDRECEAFGLPVSKEFRQLLDDKIPWNPEIARRGLAGHADLVARIEHIASLPTRSSSNMPAGYGGFFWGRATIDSANILLLKARLAAEAKDEAETLRLVAAAQNLASHFREIETPTLITYGLSGWVDHGIRDATFKHLLPALGRDADLPRWKSMLASRSYTSAELAKVGRGQWSTISQFYLFGAILDSDYPNHPPDGEALAHAYTSRYNALVTRLPTLTLAEFLDHGAEFPDESDSHLSEKSREIMDFFFGDGKSGGKWKWAGERQVKSIVRAASISAQYEAAFDLLILEKSGRKLVPELMAEVTRDPLSGSPFLFDPATRVVSPPPAAAKVDVKPLGLPW
jgi:hypothetical protein